MANEDDEKGDARRRGGGPGAQDGRGASGHTSAAPQAFIEREGTTKPDLLGAAPAGNRERHAGKRRREEAGPGRDSRTPSERER